MICCLLRYATIVSLKQESTDDKQTKEMSSIGKLKWVNDEY